MAPAVAKPASPAERVAEALRCAIARAYPQAGEATDPVLKPSGNPAFGDIQANFAMALAKSLGKAPREVAQAVLARAELAGIAEKAEVAGPGFVNIRFAASLLSEALTAMDSPALGVPRPGEGGHPVAIDLCGVNVAKEMHVGHLRATIIGDSLARIHERLGFRSLRQNHLGDWGLPIAMTLAWLRKQGTDLDRVTLADLNRAYRAAQAAGEADEAAVAEAKATLLALQSGDEAVVAAWRKLIACTMREVYDTAAILRVHLTEEHERGESFFRQRLAGVVEEFLKSGVAKEDNGAIVVPFAGRERPLLIRKSDGGFLYSTTDLAAIRYRVQELGAAKVVYVVDARQRDHFKDVFDAVRLIGWDRLPDGTQAELVHLPFGAVLGEDRKPLKTRAGELVTLRSLLNEAIERGRTQVHARAAEADSPTHAIPREELDRIGQAVGIAAIKYADMSTDVTRDYLFDLDRMVSFEGNTGPYVQYAHARIASILAKAREEGAAAGAAIEPLHDAERALALALLKHGEVIEQAARQLQPDRLCGHLSSIANLFHGFYQACPVLRCPEPQMRASRLRLCDLTRRVLEDGLGLLGIEAPPRM